MWGPTLSVFSPPFVTSPSSMSTQLDVDHVVRELPSVQEARGAREVVRQDIREEDLRDAHCGAFRVTAERHER